MRRCFLKHSEPASDRLKIGAILWNRLQDVMGLWCCVCAFMVLFCFLLFFLTLRPSKWSDGIISWQSWPWTNESILKKVTLACQEVRHRDGCRCLEHRLFYFEWCPMISPIQSLQSILTVFCHPWQSGLLICHGRHGHRHVRHQSLGASFSTSRDSGIVWKCENYVHYVHCDFASQIFKSSNLFGSDISDISTFLDLVSHHFALQGPNHPLWRWHRSIPSLAGESQCQRSIQQHGKASRWSAGRS